MIKVRIFHGNEVPWSGSLPTLPLPGELVFFFAFARKVTGRTWEIFNGHMLAIVHVD